MITMITMIMIILAKEIEKLNNRKNIYLSFTTAYNIATYYKRCMK